MAFTAETVVGAESSFSGRMTGEDLNVLGRYEGDVEIKGTLRVGPQGRMKAKVKAGVVEVRGEFEGEIRAGNLTFGETARAKGVFRADRLSIKEGAIVDGSLNLSENAKALPPVTAGDSVST